MKFNEKIVILRKQKGLTQENVAFQLGVSRQALSKWESGDCEPDFKKLKELVKLYDTSLEYLLDDDYESKIEKTDESPEIIANTKINNNTILVHRNPWFIVCIISFLMFVVLILVAAFADFDKYISGDQLGFVGFLNSWTLEIVILKIIIFISLFMGIISLLKIVLERRKYN